jgi:predicted nucleic acid-binding protein
MIVLLDTDVLIDIALDRTPHAEAATKLLEGLENRRGKGFVAWHSRISIIWFRRSKAPIKPEITSTT